MSVLFLGRATCDMTYYLQNYPEENIKIFADNFIMQPGGPALNASIVFSLLGGKAVAVSNFGNSEIARSIVNLSRNDKLKIYDLAEDENYEFPISTIMVNTVNGSRTIINSPKSKIKGENDFNDLRNFNPEMVLIDGYELENKYDIIKYWKDKNAVIVLDGGSWKDDTELYLKYVDIIICSSRFRFPGKDIDESIEELHKYGIEYAAVTNEEKPVLISVNGKRKNIPVPEINAVDSLGAGDVFHGSFCYYYSQNRNFEEAIRSAAADASNSCKYFGTLTWLKKRE